MEALTMEEHAAIRGQTAEKPGESLMAYSERVNRVKAEIGKALGARFPWSIVAETLSNGRYVVHAEAVLEAGGSIDASSLASIQPAAMRHDACAFPRLTALRPDLAK